MSESRAHNLPEYTVSEISRAVKSTLEENFPRVRVRGEVSKPNYHGSGHLYFSLKDEEAVIDAVCWRGTVGRLRLKIEHGMEVVATGRVSSYPGSSKYQIVIDSVELAGEGALLKLLEERKWDILILDINLPDRSGLDLIGHIVEKDSHLPILVLSMYPEDQYAMRTIRAGASGYLNKESAPEELVQATQRILSGGVYINESVANELVDYARREDDQPLHKSLSDREYQVLRLIASGKEIKQISSDLALSSKTVSTYRTRLLNKMNMKTNAELTFYAIQNGLVFKDVG